MVSVRIRVREVLFLGLVLGLELFYGYRLWLGVRISFKMGLA